MCALPSVKDKIDSYFYYRKLIFIKRHRQNQSSINWLIGRYWSLSTVTTIWIFFLLNNYYEHFNLSIENYSLKRELVGFTSLRGLVILFVVNFALIFLYKEKKILFTLFYESNKFKKIK